MTIANTGALVMLGIWVLIAVAIVVISYVEAAALKRKVR